MTKARATLPDGPRRAPPVTSRIAFALAPLARHPIYTTHCLSANTPIALLVQPRQLLHQLQQALQRLTRSRSNLRRALLRQVQEQPAEDETVS